MEKNNYSKRFLILGICVFAFLELAWSCSAWGYINIGLFSISFIPAMVLMGAYTFDYKVSAFAGLIFGLGSTLSATIIGESAPASAMFSAFISGKPVQSLVLCFVPRILFALLGCFAYRWIKGKKHYRLHLILSTIVVDYAHAILVYVFSATLFPEIISWSMLPPLLFKNVKVPIELAVPTILIVLLDWIANKQSVKDARTQIDEGFKTIQHFSKIIFNQVLISLVLLFLVLGIPLLYSQNIENLFPYETTLNSAQQIQVDWMRMQQLIGLASFVFAISGLVIIAYAYFVNKETVARKRIEHEMKKSEFALNEAKYANQAKTRFLSNMSHDIRTPMNAIIGYTTIASAHMDDKENVRSSLEHIMQASEHLLGLINDILDMSRIESGKEKINLSKTKLTELVRSVLPMIQTQVERKQMDLYVDTINLKHDGVYADTQKLRQILINLLSNSVKFTNNGGNVAVRLKEIPSQKEGYGRYVISVKDNGAGMKKEFLKHIFDPFEQERSNEESGEIGTGLGMSIAKGYIDMMGGSITAESEIGKGTEITIIVDLKLQEDYVRDERLSRLKGVRALVVDDDFQTCDSVTKMLNEVGMRSDWTMSSKEALLRTKKAYEEGDEFFAYVIDWIMPEINGIELAKKIRKIVGNDVPVIVLTAYDWADVIDEAKEAGVTALCTKPLFIDDLTSIFLDSMDGKPIERETIQTNIPLQFSGENVLLVEDNKMNREIATIELQEMGLNVTSAVNGAEAVDIIKNAQDWKFNFVLMDVRMPVMDGLAATKTIRAMSREYLKKVPIIALTANAFEDDIHQCLEAGMDAHVSKPFDVDQLSKILSSFSYN